MLTITNWRTDACFVDIEQSARKHGVADDDMLHAFRHHWRAFETDSSDVMMFIGPSLAGEPLEVGVVSDDGRCRDQPDATDDPGAMLGVSKQAAQRKYTQLAS